VLKAENATLRNKFATYELQPAMEHAAKDAGRRGGAAAVAKNLKKRCLGTVDKPLNRAVTRTYIETPTAGERHEESAQ